MNIRYDIDFIIRKGRFKITFYDLFKIILLYFTLLVLSICITYPLEISVSEKILLFLFCAILSFLLSLLLLRSLLNRVSFENFVNEASHIENRENIIHILNSLSMDVFSERGVIYSYYYIRPLFFNIKQDVYFIPLDNSILINIRNNQETLMFNFKDEMKEKLYTRIIQISSRVTFISN